MASIHRQPGKPFWFAAFRTPDDVRRLRSTGIASKSLARKVACEFDQASQKAKGGRFHENAARRMIVIKQNAANQDPLASSTIRDFFTDWLKRKELEAGTRPTPATPR